LQLIKLIDGLYDVIISLLTVLTNIANKYIYIDYAKSKSTSLRREATRIASSQVLYQGDRACRLSRDD